jgi:hypothetical protein
VAPTAISGNNESNTESKSNMNRWALQACSSNGSSNASNVRPRAADPSNNGASGPRITNIKKKTGMALIYQKDVKIRNLWHAYQVLPGRGAALIRSAAPLALPELDLEGFVPDSHLEIANVL